MDLVDPASLTDDFECTVVLAAVAVELAAARVVAARLGRPLTPAESALLNYLEALLARQRVIRQAVSHG